MCFDSDWRKSRPLLALIILATVVSSEGWSVSGFAEDKQQLNLTPKTQFRTASLGDTLVLPVNTLGAARSFLLDTGSSFTTYDDSLKSQLKYVADGEVEGGPRFPIYETPGATIGKLSLVRDPIICKDLSTFRKTFGLSFEGILGMTDLRSQILQIDFDNGICILPAMPSDRLGEPIDIELEEEGCPYAKFRLNGNLEVSVLLDTGFNSDFALMPNVFDTLVASGDIKVQYRSGFISVTGEYSSRVVGELKTVRLGEFSHSNVKVARWSTEDNLVGLGYLSRYLVTFDFPNKKMYLKPGKQYSRESWEDALGVALGMKNGEVIVEDFGKSTPAGEAGMNKGDVILEINGRKTSELSLFQVKRLFDEVGKARQIKFRRGNEVHSVNVLLRRLD